MKIDLKDYQPAWPEAFSNEKTAIGSILHDLDPAIEHIGSTAVPGLCAKPTIDILVGLSDEALLDRSIRPMIRSGYTYFAKHEPAMPYRRLFARLKPLTGKSPPELIGLNDHFVRGEDFISLANIHVLVRGTPHWRRHLAFRDYLRSHPEVKDQYAALKLELSKREFKNTSDYNAAKHDFIKRTEARALVWYAGA